MNAETLSVGMVTRCGQCWVVVACTGRLRRTSSGAMMLRDQWILALRRRGTVSLHEQQRIAAQWFGGISETVSVTTEPLLILRATQTSHFLNRVSQGSKSCLGAPLLTRQDVRENPLWFRVRVHRSCISCDIIVSHGR